MEKARQNHSSEVLGNKIIVVGYDIMFPVEMLDLDKEPLEWQKIAAPDFGERYNPLVAVIGKDELLIGGGLGLELKKDFFKFTTRGKKMRHAFNGTLGLTRASSLTSFIERPGCLLAVVQKDDDPQSCVVRILFKKNKVELLASGME